jgi:hypothetical protein
MKQKNPHAVALGRLGGKAGRGKAKARTTAQARKASLSRKCCKDKAMKITGKFMVDAGRKYDELQESMLKKIKATGRSGK